MGESEVEIPGKIFIGGLEIDVDEKVLEKSFGKYGRIIDTVVIKDRISGHSRGYGFVTFENPGDVVDAVKGMNKKPLHGKEIFCEQATRKGPGMSPRKRGPPMGSRGGPPPKRGMISRMGDRDGPRHREAPMRGPPTRRDVPSRGPPMRDDSMRGPARGPPMRDGPRGGRDGPIHRDLPPRGLSQRGLPSRDVPSRGPPLRDSRGPPSRDLHSRDVGFRRLSRDDGMDAGRYTSREFGTSRGARGGRGRAPMTSPVGRRSSGLYEDSLSRRDDRMTFRDERIEERETRREYLTDHRDLDRSAYDRERDSLLDSRSYSASRRPAPLSRDLGLDSFYDSRPKLRERPSTRDIPMSRSLTRDSSRDYLRDDHFDSRDIFSRDSARDSYSNARSGAVGRTLSDRRPAPSREFNQYNGSFGADSSSRGLGSGRDDFSRGPPIRRSSPARGPPSRPTRGPPTSRGPPPSRGHPSSRGPPMSRPPQRSGPSFDRPTGRPDDRGRGDISRGRGRRPDFDGPPMKRPRSSFPPRGGMSRR